MKKLLLVSNLFSNVYFYLEYEELDDSGEDEPFNDNQLKDPDITINLPDKNKIAIKKDQALPAVMFNSLPTPPRMTLIFSSFIQIFVALTKTNLYSKYINVKIHVCDRKGKPRI